MAGWRDSNRRARLPADWPIRVAFILDRDPTCRICHTAPSTEVDHIQHGDNHQLTNLQGVCTRCHATKSGREGATARQQRGGYQKQKRQQEIHPGVRTD